MKLEHTSFTREEIDYLTNVHNTEAVLVEVLEILEETGLITQDNLVFTFINKNKEFAGRCITTLDEYGYSHKIELASKSITTLIHEIAHACCFDNGLYEVYMDELDDSTAHGEDFDAMMLCITNVVLIAKGYRYDN